MPLDATNYTPQDEVLARLSTARDKIAKGWLRFELYNRGSYCARGALMAPGVEDAVNAFMERFPFATAVAHPPLAPLISEIWKHRDEIALAAERYLIFGIYGSGSGLAGIGGADAIVAWNNCPGRTQDQVLAAFDAAIAKRRADVLGKVDA
jgi:hypothetical protein